MNYKKIFTIATAVALCTAAIFFSLRGQASTNKKTLNPNDGYQKATVTLAGNLIQVRIPTTVVLQEIGLGGVTQMNDVTGMLWQFSPAQKADFWMKGMVIPLDFIWISDGKVVDLTTNVQPPTDANISTLPIIRPVVPVDNVLEVAGGYVERHSIHIGDVFDIKK